MNRNSSKKESSSLPCGASQAHEGPRLWVVSRPSFETASVAAYLASEGLDWRSTPGATAAENLVEVAGRLCYLSFGKRQSPKTNEEYVRNLIAHGHESVLEHASWSFVLTGVSRGFSHQFVRHRVGFAYSQLSQQYHDHSEGVSIMPEALRDIPAAAEKWQDAITESRRAYAELLDLLEEIPHDLPPRERLRLIRSAARTVLPAASETKLLFSANARALRHFLLSRGTIEGDEEMRQVAALVLGAMRQEAPAIFTDFRVEELADGLPVLRHTPHGG